MITIGQGYVFQNLNRFYFGWLKIKGMYTAILILIAQFLDLLKWNSYIHISPFKVQAVYCALIVFGGICRCKCIEAGNDQKKVRNCFMESFGSYTQLIGFAAGLSGALSLYLKDKVFPSWTLTVDSSLVYYQQQHCRAQCPTSMEPVLQRSNTNFLNFPNTVNYACSDTQQIHKKNFVSRL